MIGIEILSAGRQAEDLHCDKVVGEDKDVEERLLGVGFKQDGCVYCSGLGEAVVVLMKEPGAILKVESFRRQTLSRLRDDDT